MNLKTTLLAALAMLTLTVGFANADENMWGVQAVSVPVGADVIVSVPFTREASAATYTVAADVTSGSDVTFDEAFAASTYASGEYHVRIIDGDGAGLASNITANANASELTLADSGIAQKLNDGDTVRVYKNHTIGSVFADPVSFGASTSVLIYDNTANGTDKSASNIVTYVTVPFPKWGGSGSTTVLNQDQAFVVRNNGSAARTFLASGIVPDYDISFLIADSVTRDYHITSGFPIVGITVEDTDLGGTSGRSVLLYDNTDVNTDKSAANIVSYVTIPFPKWGGSGGTTPVPSVEGFIFRQSGTAGGMATIYKPY